jgi:hypothetical protein
MGIKSSINRPMSPRAILTSMVVIVYFVACGLLTPLYPSVRMGPDGIYNGDYAAYGWPFASLGVRREGNRHVHGRPSHRTDFRVVQVEVSFVALALDILWICLVVIALIRVWEVIAKGKMSAGSVAILSTCIVLVLGMLACPHAPFPEDWQIDVSNR